MTSIRQAKIFTAGELSMIAYQRSILRVHVPEQEGDQQAMDLAALAACTFAVQQTPLQYGGDLG
jgi:hypothetical protein